MRTYFRRGTRDRQKRDPSLASAVSASTISPKKIEAAASSNSEVNVGSKTLQHSLSPKKHNKRQSGGSRHGGSGSGGYPRSGRQQNNNRNPENEYGYNDNDSYDNDDYFGVNPTATDAARREYGFPGRSNSNSNSGGRGGGGGRSGGGNSRNDFDIPIPRNPGYGGGSSSGGRSPTGSRREQEDEPDIDFEAEYGGDGESPNSSSGGRGGGRRNNNNPHGFEDSGPDFGPPSSPGPSTAPGSGPPRSTGRRGQDEFGFGAPQDFGRDGGQDSQGFEQFFSIPREFDPAVQVGNSASNTNNRPVFSATNEFGPSFDTGYEDYVKQHFPEAFGSSTTGSSGGSGPEIANSHSSTYRPGPQGWI